MTAKKIAKVAKATSLVIALLSISSFGTAALAQHPARKFDGKRTKVVKSRPDKPKEKFTDEQKEAALYIQKDPAFKNLVLGTQQSAKRDFKKAEKYLLTCLAESSKPPARKQWVPFREKTIKRALRELQAIQSLYKSLGMKKKSDHLYKKVLIPWSTKIYGNKSIELKTLRAQNQPKIVRPSGAQVKLYKDKEQQYKEAAERKKRLLKEAYAKIEAEYKKNMPKQKPKAGSASAKKTTKKQTASKTK